MVSGSVARWPGIGALHIVKRRWGRLVPSFVASWFPQKFMINAHILKCRHKRWSLVVIFGCRGTHMLPIRRSTDVLGLHSLDVAWKLTVTKLCKFRTRCNNT